MRVLIIEDDPAVAETLSDILQINGFNVETAADGNAGWVAAKNDTPVLILSDVNMPGLNGLQLVQKLRADATLRNVPVIIISARREREDMRLGMELGADDYIPKPFSEQEVLRAVSAQLGKKARYDEVNSFAHTVAHDLRSPLATLYGYIDLATLSLDPLQPEDVRNSLAHARQAAHRLNCIIEDLLILAGMRKDAVDLVPFRMADALVETEERLVAVFRERGARMILPESWPVAIGHAPWVSIVWANLLSNGAKYGGENPVLELGSTKSEDGQTIRFWVRDHGPGLRNTNQERIFTPHADVAALRIDSHGLGLSIVRRVVEHLKGSCGAENMPDGGARFWFELPAWTP